MTLSKKVFITHCVILISTLFLQTSLASELIVPIFKADYTLHHNDIQIGHVALTVKKSGAAQYQLTSSTKTSGLLSFIRDDDVEESSLFDLYNGRIRPLSYHYKADLGDSQKDIILNFDWSKLKVSNSIAGRSWKLAITDGVIDKALMQIALMHDLADNDAYLSYQIADGGRLKNYVFTRIGTEKITLDGRQYDTIKLARKKDDKPLITYYWCAKSLANLPVLLRREKKYGTFEMRLDQVKFSD